MICDGFCEGDCPNIEHLKNEDVRVISQIATLAERIIKLQSKIIEIEGRIYDIEKAVAIKEDVKEENMNGSPSMVKR